MTRTLHRLAIPSFNTTLVFALAALLAGCSTKPPAPPFSARLAELQGRDLTIMTYKRADFSVKTSDDAIGGAIASAIFPLFGSLASSSMARDNGTKIIESTGIEDPAFTLVDVVQAKTVEKLNPASIRRVTNVEPQGPTFRNMDALRAAAKKGLVLEIATSYWRITYTSLGDSKYYVDYQGRARLYDAESRKLLNESWCYFNSDNEPKTAPTFEKLLADNGALLKKGLDEGMATCGEELSTYLFE